MPIQLLGGPPRSGKSHYGVKYRLMHFLKKNVVTFTDVDGLNPDEIAAYSGLTLAEVNRLVRFIPTQEVRRQLENKTFLYDPKLCPDATVRPGCHLMLDEAWRYWPSGQKLNPIESEFFPYHGHYNDPDTGNAIEITLMTQAKGQLAKEIHPLIEAEYRFRKMKITGAPDTFQVWIYDGNNRKATTHYTERYDPKIYPLYKSASNGATADDTDKRRSIFNTPLFRRVLPAMGIASVVACYFLYTSMAKLTHPKAPVSAPVDVSATVPGGTPSSGLPGPAVPVKRVSEAKTSWRIVASYNAGGQPVFVLVDEAGRYRTLTAASVSYGAAGDVNVAIPPESDSATAWSNSLPTYGALAGAAQGGKK